MKVEFASLAVSFFVHSTEDVDRLRSSICSTLGLSQEEMVTENLSGHYGNQILSVRAHVSGSRAQELCLAILRKMSSSFRTELLSELDKYVDEHDALYLRVDRQEIESRIAFGGDEPIRIKMKPRTRSGGHSSMIRYYREIIE